MKRHTKKIIILALLMVFILTLSGCNMQESYDSYIGKPNVGWGWFQWIVKLVADMMYGIASFFGDKYWIGLIVGTLIVRTVSWPIYANTNQMTLKMQLAQPDLEKLKRKYAGKTDQASKSRYNYEMMDIYKKYNINYWGCLFQILQMPIFLAMYQTVRRMSVGETKYAQLDFNFLWLDLGEADPTYILPIMVGLTMFFYQRFAMKKPEYAQPQKKYLEEKTPEKKQQEFMMKIMMYVMLIPMVWIASTNAGIALYWVVGQGYQFLQTYITRVRNKKHFLDLQQNK